MKGLNSTVTFICVDPLTMTVCVQVDELPQESVAVHVMVVVPAGNGFPNGALSLRVGTGVTEPSQLSVAVGVVGLTCANEAWQVGTSGDTLIVGRGQL